jgi:glycosyltransferase involved in cell wall biosynthesis
MHVVFITSEYPTPDLPHGGIGTFVRFLASSLVQHGIEVSVVGFYKIIKAVELVSVENGVTIYRLQTSQWKSIRFLDHSLRLNKKLTAINLKQKIDIVEAAELGLAFIHKRAGIKYVIRMHGGHHFFSQAENRKISSWRGFQEKRSFAKADALVGVSRYVVNHTASYLGFEAAKVPVIFNPVNLEKFYQANSSKIVAGRIVFVGTVCEKKGIRQLIMAMPAICKEIPTAHLIIIGRDWFFPGGQSYIQYLQKFIEPDVKGRIEFLGTLPNTEVPPLIESAEVCAYPSHMEAMPLAWLEGLAMGKAVVASKTGPGSEVIEDGITGLLCDPYNPIDIAEKINCILKNPEKRDAMGVRARYDIMHRFNINRLVKHNLGFYQSVALL